MKLPYKNNNLKKGTQNLRRKSFVMEAKNNPWVSTKRSWRKASPLMKGAIIGGAILPKALFVGAGYLAAKGSSKKEKPKKYMAG